MKLLLYSHAFYPSIGGVETVSKTLADGFYEVGIDCKLITATIDNEELKFPYEVIRKPNRRKQISLIKWADIVLFNGASLALQPWILFYRKPFIWTHVGYQVSCIDGAGWLNGEMTPLTPGKSFFVHLKKTGLSKATVAGIKLFTRRFFAKYLVNKNIAITDWMLKKQPLPRQIRIYNPFPIDTFRNCKSELFEYEFMYLGRIVSEKGISTLLNAFSIVNAKNKYRLLIIGNGDWQEKMENLAKTLNIENYVDFVGKKTGDELLKYVSLAKIAIIPSEWYEPMGVVAVELLAAGKNLIVSEYGGLKECVEGSALTFKNGDASELAKKMLYLSKNKKIQKKHLFNSKDQLKKFETSLLIEEYISILKEIVNESNIKSSTG